MKKTLAILGSTGSIGSQALEVIDIFSDKFELELLTANRNADLLIEQAIKYLPKNVVIADENLFKQVADALSSYPIKVLAGHKTIAEIVEIDTIDMILSAMVGYAGLLPTINAIKTGKDIALANKETLVIAGELITKLASENSVNIYPVDSEHSAIFQCLVGEMGNPVEKIYLTASGGPFRNKDINYLKTVSCEEALKHPNWNMGKKITIDSSTLMNKGFEVIEAKWLFNILPEQIEVIIHPQSIIHSIVQFEDGSMKAQMGLPDMKLPIQYALTHPYRLKSAFPRFSFLDYPDLNFEQVDIKKFRNLALSYEALRSGGNKPCALNAINEVVVEAFLQRNVGFLEMSDIIEKTLDKVNFIIQPSYEDYVETDKESRIIAEKFINK